MRAITGTAVKGESFFGRDTDLDILKQKIVDGDHVLLTGQRRMGKTSIAHELGLRLETEGWSSIYVDIEGALSVKDMITKLGHAIFQIAPIAKRIRRKVEEKLDRIEKVEAFDFALQLSETLDSGNWRDLGSQLFEICRNHDKKVFLVIDELPILLSRLLKQDETSDQIEIVLSWFRAELQMVQNAQMAVLFSGSIGLVPLVTRLGISDRINHLYEYRLGPWSQETSIACLKCLSESCEIPMDENVPQAMVEKLGLGIPSLVQQFFDRIRTRMRMEGLTRVTESDVDIVYSRDMLGPSGSKDLYHFESRLSDCLDDETYEIAMRILTEAAVVGTFSDNSKNALIAKYSRLSDDSVQKVGWALDTLLHDEYLQRGDLGYFFNSKLLRDWWKIRFEHSYEAIDRSNQ